MKYLYTYLLRFLRLIQIIDNKIAKCCEFIFPKRWQLDGGCLQCGKCCKNIGIEATPWVIKTGLAMKLVIWWYEQVNCLYFKGIIEDENMLIFGCHHQADKLCGRYHDRPPLCRNYPKIPYFKEPAVLPWCGYKTAMKK